MYATIYKYTYKHLYIVFYTYTQFLPDRSSYEPLLINNQFNSGSRHSFNETIANNIELDAKSVQRCSRNRWPNSSKINARTDIEIVVGQS